MSSANKRGGLGLMKKVFERKRARMAGWEGGRAAVVYWQCSKPGNTVHVWGRPLTVHNRWVVWGYGHGAHPAQGLTVR